MAGSSTRKWTRDEVTSGLRYLYDIYHVAPAYQAHYSYLLELELSTNTSRRLPKPFAIYKYWPNIRDAWLAIGIQPSYTLQSLNTGFIFNNKLDTQIRKIFANYPQREKRHSLLRQLARSVNIPLPALALRAIQLSVDNLSSPHWTETEIQILENTSHLSKQKIAQALTKAGFHRSHQTGRIINARRAQLNSDRPSHYSKEQLSNLFGVDSHCITNWLRKKWLSYEMKGTVRTKQQGGDTYLISRTTLGSFIRTYPELVDFRKVNHTWLLQLIKDTEVSTTRDPFFNPQQKHQGGLHSNGNNILNS